MMLARCKTTAPKAPVNGIGKVEENKENAMLVTNLAAFDIVEDLVSTHVPLLKEYDEVYKGEQPDVEDEENMRDLVKSAMRAARHGRFAHGGGLVVNEQGLMTELLVTTLQIYSDHPEKYAILEERHRILSFYLVAFPTFEDENLKVMILKTLEFVLTGVAGTGAIIPTKIACEVFFTLCKTLLNGMGAMDLDAEQKAVVSDKLLTDADLVCQTFEKLLEFDSRVGQIMTEGGILSDNLNAIWSHVTEATESLASDSDGAFTVNDKTFRHPRDSTLLDSVFAAVCRVLRLVVAEQSGSSSPRDSDNDTPSPMTSNLNSLLLTAVNNLGDDACVAALRIFETKMSAQRSPEVMEMDMSGRLGGLSIFDQDEQPELDSDLHVVLTKIILRQVRVYKMLKDVLERSALAQDAFRTQGGFESIIRTVGCLSSVVDGGDSEEEDEAAENEDEELESCRADCSMDFASHAGGSGAVYIG